MGENFYTDLATVPIIIIQQQQQQQRLAAVATSQQLSSTTRRPPLPSTADNFTRNALPISTPPPLEAGGAEYCDERVCVLCPRAYLRNYMSNLHQISVHVTYDRRSALLRRRCDTLSVSGFMDDMTSYQQTLQTGRNLIASFCALNLRTFFYICCFKAVAFTRKRN